MQRPFTHHQLTFDILYHTYWERVVRFCRKHLATLPDGTAEEVAQDVFLAAHRAIEQQRYKGDSPISTWLFGIAHNLCCKAWRDMYRKTTSQTLRHLEREIARLEHEVMRLARETLREKPEHLGPGVRPRKGIIFGVPAIRNIHSIGRVNPVRNS